MSRLNIGTATFQALKFIIWFRCTKSLMISNLIFIFYHVIKIVLVPIHSGTEVVDILDKLAEAELRVIIEGLGMSGVIIDLRCSNNGKNS